MPNQKHRFFKKCFQIFKPQVEHWNPQVWKEENVGLRFCPPGFLLSLAMKLFESAHSVSEREVIRDMLIYIKLLHEYIRTDQLPADSFNQFPVYEVMKSAQKSLMERYHSSEVWPPISVTIVVSACKEDLVFLGRDISHEIRQKTRIAIVQKCGDFRERWQWVPTLYKSVDFVNVDDQIRGDECSAYLGYISQRYSTLSNYTIFVHADIQEHVDMGNPPNILTMMLSNIHNGG